MDISLKGRAILAQKTMEIYEDYRLTGVGVGNFKYAYPRYQPPEFNNRCKKSDCRGGIGLRSNSLSVI